MPFVKFFFFKQFIVLDEEDTTITAGSIVTVTVHLIRKDMGEMFEKQIVLSGLSEEAGDHVAGNEEENEEREQEEEDEEEKQVRGRMGTDNSDEVKTEIFSHSC